MKKYKTIFSANLAFNILSYGWISALAILCFLPFLLVISGSLTDESSIILDGFKLIPSKFSLSAYAVAFSNYGVILKAYAVTIFVTVVGTLLSVFLISMAAYALHRKDFYYRNFFAFFFYFTTIFSGGLVPWYILMVKYLNMKNSYLALIIPMLFSMFYMIIIRTFMSSIPDSISESAKIDGANDFIIYFRLIIPLSKPALATVGLFTALGYWNDWYLSMLFIDKQEMYPLQYFLNILMSKVDFLKNMTADTTVILSQVTLPSESFKLAMTVIVTGPIVFLYPFIQRFYVKGITLGAVKG